MNIFKLNQLISASFTSVFSGKSQNIGLILEILDSVLIAF